MGAVLINPCHTSVGLHLVQRSVILLQRSVIYDQVHLHQSLGSAVYEIVICALCWLMPISLWKLYLYIILNLQCCFSTVIVHMNPSKNASPISINSRLSTAFENKHPEGTPGGVTLQMHVSGRGSSRCSDRTASSKCSSSFATRSY